MNRAVEEGNFFLYTQAVSLFELGEDLDALRKLAKNAMDRGRFAYARRAFLAAGDEAEANEAQTKLKELLPHANLLFEEEEEP